LPKTYFGDLILAVQIIFISTKYKGRQMVYAKMPMMIFALASGYLFSVYLLLALAKRSGKKESRVGVSFVVSGKQHQEVQVRQNLPEVGSS
jgi:hypothetical protein